MSAGGEDREEWRKALARAFARMPHEYPAAYQEWLKMSRAFHEELARAVKPQLNEYVQGLPHDTLAEKSALAQRVNGDLRALHLCLQYEPMDCPAILVADSRDGGNKEGRFRLQVTEGGKQLRKAASRRVPHLEIREAPVRIESLASRSLDRPGPDSTRSR